MLSTIGLAPLVLLGRRPRTAHAVEEVVERSSSSGTHAVPCSVNTTWRSGWRSNTPPTMRWVSARCAHHVTSSRNTTASSGSGPMRRGRTAGVVVDRHAELLAHRPERLVVALVELGQPDARRRAGEQHAAGEPGVVGPADLLDRRLDVVEHDLRDAGATAGCVVAEVDEPAVVGLEPGPALLDVGGVTAAAGRSATPSGRTAAPCSGRSPRRPCRRPRGRARRRSESQLRAPRSPRRSSNGIS